MIILKIFDDIEKILGFIINFHKIIKKIVLFIYLFDFYLKRICRIILMNYENVDALFDYIRF